MQRPEQSWRLVFMQTKMIKAVDLCTGMRIALGFYGPESRVTRVYVNDTRTYVTVEVHDRDYPIYFRVHARIEVAS